MRKIILIISCFLLSQNDNYIIDNIDIEGNVRISDENIKFISGLEEGVSINNFNIQNAIKKLWDTNLYLDIRIDVDKKYLSNRLMIYVEEAPFINQIVFNGNKKVTNKKLIEEFSVKKGDLLNYNDINEAIISIENYYKNKNYHNVMIDYKIQSPEDKNQLIKVARKDVIVDIYEGKKIKLKDVIIEGNNSFSDKILIKQFQDLKIWKWYAPWKGDFDEEKYNINKLILEDFYFNKGYKDFHINKDSVIYEDDRINIYLSIEEGVEYFVREISWDGNVIKTDSILNRISQLKSGDLYSRQNLNQKTIESIRSLYMNEGFLNFNIESIVRPVKSESNLVDIQFILNENEIFSVNNIIITGNQKTHENVIRRELNVFPGEKFNRNKLYESVRDLWMLNFFSDVVPRVIPVSEDKINLEIEVVEKNVGTANFSMGYNQMHGFQGGGGFEFPNFRGKGQNLSISYQRGLSSGNGMNNQYSSFSSSNTNKYESFSISFFDPALFDTPNSIGVSISHSERGQGQNSYWPFDSDNSRFSVRFGRSRLKWPDRYFRIMWSYAYSQDRNFSNDINDLTSYWGSTIEPYIDYSNNNYVFKTSGVSLSQTITRDSRNRPEFPTKGSKMKLTSSLSGSFLGGDHDYTKNTFEFNSFRSINFDFLKSIISLGAFVPKTYLEIESNEDFDYSSEKTSKDNLILSQTFKVGSLSPINMPENQRSVVPISARYFMGGSGMSYGESLRGYPQNSIGPYDYRPRGGNLMLKYSLEFRVLVSNDPTVFSFLFADMGNVWSDYDIIKLTDLKRSVGIGIRLYMPMLGVLGYDIGYGFDKTILDNRSSHGFEHHFVFGMPLN